MTTPAAGAYRHSLAPTHPDRSVTPFRRIFDIANQTPDRNDSGNPSTTCHIRSHADYIPPEDRRHVSPYRDAVTNPSRQPARRTLAYKDLGTSRHSTPTPRHSHDRTIPATTQRPPLTRPLRHLTHSSPQGQTMAPPMPTSTTVITDRRVHALRAGSSHSRHNTTPDHSVTTQPGLLRAMRPRPLPAALVPLLGPHRGHHSGATARGRGHRRRSVDSSKTRSARDTKIICVLVHETVTPRHSPPLRRPPSHPETRLPPGAPATESHPCEPPCPTDEKARMRHPAEPTTTPGHHFTDRPQRPRTLCRDRPGKTPPNHDDHEIRRRPPSRRSRSSTHHAHCHQGRARRSDPPLRVRSVSAPHAATRGTPHADTEPSR